MLDICARKCYTVLVKGRDDHRKKSCREPQHGTRVTAAEGEVSRRGLKKFFEKLFKNPLTNSPRSAILKAQDKERVATYARKGDYL